MDWPNRISVYHKLHSPPSLNDGSFVLNVMITSDKHRRPAARCLETLVVYDYSRKSKSPLKTFMIENFQRTFALQEESRERNQRLLQNLFARTDKLERQSWRDPAAVEDKWIPD